MNRSAVRAGVVVGSLAALLLGYATSQAQMAKVGSGDVVADRQRLMKLNGASLQDLNAKLKAGNVEAAVVNAETIAINARHIPALFPKGSLSGQVEREARHLGEVAGVRGRGQEPTGEGGGAPGRCSEEGYSGDRGGGQGLLQAKLQPLPHTVPGAPRVVVSPPARGARGSGLYFTSIQSSSRHS